MRIWIGERAAGQVDARGGEYADTLYVHLYMVPLFPVSSRWVTAAAAGYAASFPIPLHTRSALSIYLRWGAPLVALAVGRFAPLVTGIPVAAVLCGLCAWAWSWRTVRGELPRRRSDFSRLAYGARCDPSAMQPELRGQLASVLRASWAARATTRTPDDVARHGALDVDEAILAYGILRLAAVEPGGVEARVASDRILRGAHEPPPADAAGDPYRAHPVVATANVHASIADAAASLASGAVERSPLEQVTRAALTNQAFAQESRAKERGIRVPDNLTKLVVGAAIVAIVSVSVAATYLPRLLVTPTPIALADLHGAPPSGVVSVGCEKAPLVMRQVQGQKTLAAAFLCVAGGQGLVVVAGDTDDRPRQVTGELRSPTAADNWLGRVLAEDHVLPYVLDQQGLASATVGVTAAAVGGVLALGMGMLVIRRRRRCRN